MKATPIHAMNLLIGQRLHCYRFYAICAIFIALLTPATALGQSGTPQEGPSAVEQPPAPGQAGTLQEFPPASEQAPAATSAKTPVATPTQAPTISPATLPRDLNPWGMFMDADWVVKTVIIGLALASILTWTLCLAKSLELKAGKHRLQAALEGLWETRAVAEGIDRLHYTKGIAEWFADAVERELHFSADFPPEGIKDRLALQLSRVEAAASRRIARGTGLLATIGSTAPFVGLFGTVWGIMNSFIGISEAQTTNLAVVAPGIAEALLVTAIGLVTAIPAVVIYNLLARSTAGYRALLADTVSEVLQLVSRDLDRQPQAEQQQLRQVAR